MCTTVTTNTRMGRKCGIRSKQRWPRSKTRIILYSSNRAAEERSDRCAQEIVEASLSVTRLSDHTLMATNGCAKIVAFDGSPPAL
jgi:hypothetical protein